MTPGKAQVPGTETQHESASAGAQPGIHPEGQTTRVAFLGPQGTFTEQALQQMIAAGYLPGSTEGVAVKSPSAALEAVRNHSVDYACVALESSVDGPIAQTEDALTMGSPLIIVREVLVPVEFSILVRSGATTEDVQTFTTHPAAEAQTRSWVQQHLPNAQFVPASSNGAAAQAVAEGRADAAAAPARAGQIHQLESLAEAVADVRGAYTRFVLVSRPGQVTPKTGNDRTGVAFTLENKPSGLLDALAELSVRGIDMSRISSRPTREAMGTYYFHLGLVGHLEDEAMAEALAGLYRSTSSLRFLGSWPRAELPGAGVGKEQDAHHPPAGTFPPDYSESRGWVAELKQQTQPPAQQQTKG